ncbi:MAG: hypothetical protein H0T42_13260 [Deltaproteobacteria bacterium]|nr:hypothetical protein [Deltaproteobacteria bacterium]
MAKGKPTPEKSKIERERPLAYSRRHKGGGDDKPADPSKADAEEAPEEATPDAKADAPTPTEASTDASPAIEPPPPKGEPWPDATPQPMTPVEPARARTETVAMPAELATGAPPEMPAVQPGSAEDLTVMPGPRDIPGGNPGDPAAAPGRVPSGDSRSLRKDNEFALVYRVQTAVISRFGVVGTRGQWRVVDYPTSSSASSAYAKEVSRFVAEGFSDYRD